MPLYPPPSYDRRKKDRSLSPDKSISGDSVANSLAESSRGSASLRRGRKSEPSLRHSARFHKAEPLLPIYSPSSNNLNNNGSNASPNHTAARYRLPSVDNPNLPIAPPSGNAFAPNGYYPPRPPPSGNGGGAGGPYNNTKRPLPPPPSSGNSFLSAGQQVLTYTKHRRRRRPKHQQAPLLRASASWLRASHKKGALWLVLGLACLRCILFPLGAGLFGVIMSNNTGDRAPTAILPQGSRTNKRNPGAAPGSLGETLLARLTLVDEEDQAKELALERDVLLNHDGHEKRLSLLEQVAPQWFHRNDRHPSEDNEDAPDSLNEVVEKEGVEKKGSTAVEPDKDPPPEIIAESGKTLRTLHTMGQFTNYSSCPANLPSDELRITLVVQSTLNRVWVLEETCTRWKDPIVAVVALTRLEEQEGAATAMEEWRAKCPHLNVILHIMTEAEEQPEMYPVNELRNKALDAVETSHILMMDVDFVPSENLHDTIHSALEERAQLREYQNDTMVPEEREALVVPAFDRILHPPCTSDADCMQHLRRDHSFIPRAFSDLKTCYEAGNCIVFQSENNPEGHSSTRTHEWLETHWYNDKLAHHKLEDNTTIRSVRTVDCFDSLRYEPYVVLRWCPAAAAGESKDHPAPVAPYYDERFHGYGKNKIQHIQHLRLMGYHFAVLPEGFIVHNPHKESKVKEAWNNVNEIMLHRSMDELYKTFIHELVHAYKDEIEIGGIVDNCQQ